MKWERLIVTGGELPRDPRKRVGEIVGTTPDAIEPAVVALIEVAVHSDAALRCRERILAVDPDAPSREIIRVLGDAKMACVSLYLAARAAQMYCDEHDEPGPLGRVRLDTLVVTAEHLRDCVMHWDGKAKGGQASFLNVTEEDLLVLGTDRRRRQLLAGLTWRDFESHLRRLGRWAEMMLEERIGDGVGPDAAGQAPVTQPTRGAGPPRG